MVKDEKLIDRFDIVFGNYFNSLDQIEIDDVLKQLSIPNTWLKKLFERYFSKEEMDKVKSQGDYEKLIEKFHIWSLYNRTEIVYFLGGFIIGVILIWKIRNTN